MFDCAAPSPLRRAVPIVGLALALVPWVVAPVVAQGGYGGARVAVTRVAGRTGLLGGGPLAAFVFGRWTAGVTISPSEGDAAGLQLVPVGPFLEYDLTPEALVHVLPSLHLVSGAAIYDGAGDRWTAVLLGAEPRLTAVIGGRGTRIGLSVGWRFARAASSLGDLGRDLSGPVAGFELRDGVFLSPGAVVGRGDPGRRGRPDGAGEGRRPGWFLTSLYGTRVTRFAGETVHLDGGGTRVAVGRWRVGLGGWVTRDWLRSRELAVAGGWGGLVAECQLSEAGVAPWVGVMLGGGGLGRRIPGTDEYETAGMFVLEPNAGMVWPVFPFLRLAAVVGYRWAGCGECIPDVTATDLRGLSVGVDIRFGHFESR